MAPYSRGGALKFAATSRKEGIVICCHGLCAGTSNGKRKNTSVPVRLLSFMHLPPVTVVIVSSFGKPGLVAAHLPR
jgi:hypothetical protein